jgi:hypothetical protein
MMKRSTVCLVLAILLAASHLYAAKVTNIELSHQKNTTVARIDIDGQVRFTHQTEEPKDGKPHRVIVDILTATHQLGARSFSELPPCAIKTIRTSQFAVSPEKIVRVVFDMDRSPLYRIESTSKSVFVYFTDKSAPPFSTWVSSETLTSPTPEDEKTTAKVAMKPSGSSQPTATRDKVAEAEPKTVTKPEPTEVSQATKKTAVSQAKVEKEPQSKTTSAPAKVAPNKPVITAQKPPPEPKAVAQAKTSEKKTEETATPKVKTKPVVASADNRAKQPTEPSPPRTVAEDGKGKKTEKVGAPKTDRLKSAEKPAVDKKKTSTAPVVAAKEPTSSGKKTSTARFRRAPASNKIKGTMVAEFPKRLVIKYKAKSRRDPFETLINETKTHDNPIEQRVPNVEGLRLVGIIESNGEFNRALFEDNDGYGYILKSGDKVRNGYVLRVESDRVYFQIFEYGWSRTVALKIEQ